MKRNLRKIKYIEVNPLPQRCLECQEAKEGKALGLTEDAYCYNCDFALDRWKIVKDEPQK